MGSTRILVKFRETIEQTSFTPPSPIKATPTPIPSNSNDAGTKSVCKASDVMMTSSSQKEGILKKKSILPNKDPPEGKTTAVVPVMRGRPKRMKWGQYLTFAPLIFLPGTYVFPSISSS